MRARALAVLILSLLFAAAPLLTPGFGGYDPSQFPVDLGDPPMIPAGWAFAIWGVIYLWLVVSAAFGLWRRAGNAGWDRTRAPLLVSLACGVPWLSVATSSPVWATLLIWPMAIFAIVALIRAPNRDRWWLRAPLGLYAGWLTAASAVSTGTLGAGFGVAMGPPGWALATVAAAAAIGLGVLARRPAPAYGAALIWALIGLMARNGFDAVGIAALAAVAAVAIVTHLRRAA